MKVLAINGSARKKSNTSLLIQTVFEELEKELPTFTACQPLAAAGLTEPFFRKQVPSVYVTVSAGRTEPVLLSGWAECTNRGARK